MQWVGPPPVPRVDVGRDGVVRLIGADGEEVAPLARVDVAPEGLRVAGTTVTRS